MGGLMLDTVIINTESHETKSAATAISYYLKFKCQKEKHEIILAQVTSGIHKLATIGNRKFLAGKNWDNCFYILEMKRNIIPDTRIIYVSILPEELVIEMNRLQFELVNTFDRIENYI